MNVSWSSLRTQTTHEVIKLQLEQQLRLVLVVVQRHVRGLRQAQMPTELELCWVMENLWILRGFSLGQLFNSLQHWPQVSATFKRELKFLVDSARQSMARPATVWCGNLMNFERRFEYGGLNSAGSRTGLQALNLRDERGTSRKPVRTIVHADYTRDAFVCRTALIIAWLWHLKVLGSSASSQDPSVQVRLQSLQRKGISKKGCQEPRLHVYTKLIQVSNFEL